MKHWLLLFNICALAAAQEPTKLGQHTIGETIQQWASVTHALEELGPACKGKTKDKAKCTYLTEISNGTAARTFYLDVDRSYVFDFLNGKLAIVTIKPNTLAVDPKDRVLDFEDEVDLLTESYGKPAETTLIDKYNAYGVKWKRRICVWTLPDGTQITATEDPELNGEDKLLSIVFTAKDAMVRRNPYK